MPDQPTIEQLVERFYNDEQRRLPTYNETEARVQYINPLFRALGWDVDNIRGRGEVRHEDTVTIGGKAKAPDYGFYLDNRRRFFVEAKKPAVNLDQDVAPAYQLRRYGWTAKLPLSILTDFQEFAVYDTRVRPHAGDNPKVARTRYWTYKEYPDVWDEIAAVFSREAVLSGSLEQYAAEQGGKKGVATVDAEFLKEIERWRELLARNIALRNPGLDERGLNFAVQQTIDRLLFLRIAEDRGIEPYGRLQGLLKGGDLYSRLFAFFNQADARYNSGLFHFAPERGRGDPDLLTPRLNIDDKALKEIIGNLYAPASPYEFSVFPADILGQVYEQFLGKVIRLTGKSAKVEEKPEVRKAGGVYYTPTYIVEYIVRQTVGKLVEGHAPDPTGPVSRVRVLDPACGSGSFLLGAYAYLLDWHLRGYLTDAGKWSKGRNKTLHRTAAGEYHLTLAERKRILLDNLYGVDIDPQAVEVTKLSLLLKALEDTPDALSGQLALLPERVLPDLDNNIKCGNSLIGPDFYAQGQLALFDREEQLRINAFDWQAEFRDVMSVGGFDAVIGNPPYIRIQTMKEWAPVEVEHYKRAYRAAGKGNYDIYVVFVEKGLSLLNPRGRLGFILPHKFFNSQYGTAVRSLIAEGKHLSQIVHFGANQIFVGATTYTCLLFLSKREEASFKFRKIENLEQWRVGEQQNLGLLPAEYVNGEEWNFVVGDEGVLFEKLRRSYSKLGSLIDVFVGLQTSADDVFILDYVEHTPEGIRLYSKALGSDWVFEPDLVFPIVSGTDVNRYRSLPERQYIIFPYSVTDKEVKLIDLKDIFHTFPKTAKYLLSNRGRLEGREKGRLKGKDWHGYIYLKNMQKQAIKKLCVPRLVEHLYASYDVDGTHFLDNVDVGGLTWKPGHVDQSSTYLLGLLNSKLLRWYFPFVSAPFRGGWLSANRQFVEQLPIRTIDFSDPADVARHDQMVTLVQRMLDLHKELAAERNPQVKTVLQRQIEATDAQIDRLVYELYGLSEEEVAIVEGR